MSLTKQELSEKTKAQDIPGRSSMGHDELAATVGPRLDAPSPHLSADGARPPPPLAPFLGAASESGLSPV
ncbi:MAG: hypothetical protein ABSC30_07270 [Acidimicrobiales bacterium]